MRTRHLILAPLLLTLALLGGCVVSETEQPYELSTVRAMAPGQWYHFDLHGGDSAGDAWRGGVSRYALEPQWVDGRWATPVRTDLELLHLPSGGRLLRTMTLYLDAYGREVLLDYDNGLSCHAQTANDIPDWAYTGAYGELAAFSCSDGSQLAGYWDLNRLSDIGADFVTLTTTWYGHSAESVTETTQTIAHDGTVIGYALNLYLPEYGVSLWLSS
jgi:hypothetical protein